MFYFFAKREDIPPMHSLGMLRGSLRQNRLEEAVQRANDDVEVFQQRGASGDTDPNDDDIGASLVAEVLAENPPRERGEREGWLRGWGVGRTYDVRNHN